MLGEEPKRAVGGEDCQWRELRRMRPPRFRAATELVARGSSEGAREKEKLWFAPACRLKAERSKARVLTAGRRKGGKPDHSDVPKYLN